MPVSTWLPGQSGSPANSRVLFLNGDYGLHCRIERDAARLMPYVQSPVIGVATMQPGLPAEDVEQYISKPIEERIMDIKGVRYIRRTSQKGFSMVSLEYPYGYDMRRALIDVQLMAVVQGELPRTGSNLKPSWVLPIDPLNLPVLSLNLSSQTLDKQRLRQLADNEITNRLKGIPGVWSVTTFGGYRQQMQVLLTATDLVQPAYRSWTCALSPPVRNRANLTIVSRFAKMDM